MNTEFWKDVALLQKNWFGQCDGVCFIFKLQVCTNALTCCCPVSFRMLVIIGLLRGIPGLLISTCFTFAVY